MSTKIEQIIPDDVFQEMKKLDNTVRQAREVCYALSDQLYILAEPYINLHDIELDKELLEILLDGSIQFELRRRIRALKKLDNGE